MIRFANWLIFFLEAGVAQMVDPQFDPQLLLLYEQDICHSTWKNGSYT